MGDSEHISTTRTDDDLRDVGDDVSRAAGRTADKVGDAASDAKDTAKSAGHKLSDAVEDMIPGDSDADGHVGRRALVGSGVGSPRFAAPLPQVPTPYSPLPERHTRWPN